MTTRTVIRNAIKEIEKNGWCQGEYRDEQGRVCLVESVRRSTRHLLSLEAMDLDNKVFTKIADHTKVAPCSVWNDTPGRTKEEVLSMLRGLAR